MNHRTGLKGQVVIPKALREQLGLLPGNEVEFTIQDGSVRVVTVASTSSMRESLAGAGPSELLEADRRSEHNRRPSASIPGWPCDGSKAWSRPRRGATPRALAVFGGWGRMEIHLFGGAAHS